MSDFTIQNVIIPQTDGYTTTDVQIVDDKITAIAPHLDIIGRLVNGENQLLLPGFVNAHTHSSEMWLRGLIPPFPLELWLAELYAFPLLTPEQVYLSALGTAGATLLSGGTTVVDHLVLIPNQELDTVAAAVRGYKEIGIRAFIAPLIQDLPLSMGIPAAGTSQTHKPFFRSTDETLEFMATVIQQFHDPESGIHIAVAPTGPQFAQMPYLLDAWN